MWTSVQQTMAAVVWTPRARTPTERISARVNPASKEMGSRARVSQIQRVFSMHFLAQSLSFWFVVHLLCTTSLQRLNISRCCTSAVWLDVQQFHKTYKKYCSPLWLCTKIGEGAFAYAPTHSETVAEQLAELFNMIWQNLEVPEDWKKGVIIKLPKKEVSRTANWRGITLLSTPGKVFSRMLLNRLQDAVDCTLRDEQAGFRKGRSCTEQIFNLHWTSLNRA